MKKLGITYPVGTLPPKRAKYKLLYWDKVVYFKYKTEAEEARDGLDYYHQEDAVVEPIRRRKD